MDGATKELLLQEPAGQHDQPFPCQTSNDWQSMRNAAIRDAAIESQTVQGSTDQGCMEPIKLSDQEWITA
jgi:hypothetical protein